MDYDRVLDGPWHAYRTWAGTSRYLRQDLAHWTHVTLTLAILGAIFAAAAQEFHLFPALTEIATLKVTTIAQGAAIVASFAVALSAYFGREALAQNKTADWIKARSAAESIKSAIYLYRAEAPPYDTANRADLIRDRVDAVELGLAAIQTRSAGPDTKPAELSPLTVDSYITQRVDDQIRYYDQRSAQYEKQNDTLRSVIFWLGALSALFAISATVRFIPALTAMIATLSASLAAYAQSQQLQTLIVSYEATSRRLLNLKGAWAASQKTDADTAERNAFIQNCEHALAMENGAWAGSWSNVRQALPPAHTN